MHAFSARTKSAAAGCCGLAALILPLLLQLPARAAGAAQGPEANVYSVSTLFPADQPAGRVVVPPGQTWYVDTSFEAETITVQGRLLWDNLTLRTAYLLVQSGGYFQLGTAIRPMEKRATIDILVKPIETYSDVTAGYRFVVANGTNARIDIHGRELSRTWSLLSEDAHDGDTELFLKHGVRSMGWQVGDRIGLVTTTQGKSQEHRIKAIVPATGWRLYPTRAVAGVSVAATEDAAMAIDGQESTDWSSYCTWSWCTGAEQWLEIYLPAPATITKLRIKWDTTRYAPKFRVEGRSAQGSLFPLASTSVAGGGWSTVTVDLCSSGCAATSVRITGDYDSMKQRSEPAWAGLRIWEIEVFGREDGRPVPDVIRLQDPVTGFYNGGNKTVGGFTFEMAAEVVNLERSVLITGDAEFYRTTRQGLHTALMGEGVMDVRYTRFENCGQRDKMGRCIHFHMAKHCPACIAMGNAIVNSAQPAITMHGTHRSLVESIIIWQSDAVGIYTEDGNEMYNRIVRNVVVCPGLPLSCSVSWQFKPAAQAGIYMIGMTKDLIENRVAGYENGIWTAGTHATAGQGKASGKVCPQFTPFGTIRGNVCHDNFRFGLYLDNQHPRKITRDDNGMVTDPGSCSEFLPDGSDNGARPANVIEDEFDYHNMFVGQYHMGDVSFVRLTGLNNAHSMYWKSSKNFADGVSHHIRDSIFANDPADRFGVLQLLGPGGPFTFRFTNNSFAGSPVGYAALGVAQHCGKVGAGGPCDVQYLLQAVNWKGLQPSARRLKLGVNSEDEGYVLPIMMALDDSLEGYRGMVSKHMKGFLSVPGCRAMDAVIWDGAIACSATVRRLNVWSKNIGFVNVSGPGMVRQDDMITSSLVNGLDAGVMTFEDNQGSTSMGYGLPVLAGQNYTVSGAWSGAAMFEFSDNVMTTLTGAEEVVGLSIVGGPD